jgi:hypothetical protein
VESTVSWVALVVAINLGLNSLTFLLVLAQNLRLSSYLSMREYHIYEGRRDGDT